MGNLVFFKMTTTQINKKIIVQIIFYFLPLLQSVGSSLY
jgi:hypothetical protein